MARLQAAAVNSRRRRLATWYDEDMSLQLAAADLLSAGRVIAGRLATSASPAFWRDGASVTVR